MKQIELSNIIPYICAIQSRNNMKLNSIKTVLSKKGISQTWLAKQLGKSFSIVRDCRELPKKFSTFLMN